MTDYTYGDKIRIKGEKRIRKVITDDKDYVYYGSFGDKIRKEFVEKLTNNNQ